MSSFPGKLIGLILAFLPLVFNPLTTVILTQNIGIERTSWNYLTDFTDTVCDKGILTANDYQEFITKLGATTVDYEVIISAQHKLVLPNGSGGFVIRHVSSGLFKSSSVGVIGDFSMEAGDNLQVMLRPLSVTQNDNLLRNIFKLHVNRLPLSYSANVRNDGS